MELERSNGCVLDSSVWTALFLEGDSNHYRALKEFDDLIGPVYVPYIVLAETATVLVKKYSKAQANTFVQFVSEDARCVFMENNSTVDASYFLSINEEISFADVAIIECARALGATLITFDKQMKNVYVRSAKS